MAHTVTFTSGVYLGTRQATALDSSWFDAETTEEFTEFTLALADLQALNGVQGMPGRRKPVILRFTGSGLATVEEALHTIEAYPLMNGGPRRTMSGYLDVVAAQGHLCKMSLSLYGDSSDREEWGVLADVQPSIDGGARGWSVVATFYPCDLLWYTGSGSVAIRPGAEGAPA